MVNFFTATGNTQAKHDSDGRVVEITDPIGARTEIEYGYLGLPISVRKFDNTSTPIRELLRDYNTRRPGTP